MELFDLLLYKSVAGDSGGGGDITLRTLNVTQNGTTNAPSGEAYNKVVANVPNSYAASDEGKVVSNGALVAQTAHAEVTENGTYDTTDNNSVTVNVSGGGIDATQYCTSIVFADQYPSANPNLYLPKVSTFDGIFYRSFNGPYETIELSSDRPIVSLRNAFASFRADTTLSSVTLNADLSACTSYQDAFWNLTALEEIKGTPLDFTLATATNNAYRNFNGDAALRYVRYKPNSLSKGQSLLKASSLSDDSIVSIANGLVAVSGFTITFHADVKAKLSTIMGSVSQVTENEVSYDFFTADAQGTVSLMDFITNTKGWTVA